MDYRGNGRFHIPEEGDEDSDPHRHFPMTESYRDFKEREREFEITMRDVAFGYCVEARETGVEDGYCFTAFDANSPYLALGQLRCRMYRALSTRHLEKRDEQYIPAHDILRGRITWDGATETVAFVVDGILLPLDVFARVVSTFEGFQFRLEFFDRSAEVP